MPDQKKLKPGDTGRKKYSDKYGVRLISFRSLNDIETEELFTLPSPDRAITDNEVPHQHITMHFNIDYE